MKTDTAALCQYVYQSDKIFKKLRVQQSCGFNAEITITNLKAVQYLAATPWSKQRKNLDRLTEN